MASHWISGIMLGNLNKLEKKITDTHLTPKMLSSLISKADIRRYLLNKEYC